MKTAAEEHNVFKMLNDLPSQRHMPGSILLNGDAHKRKGNQLRNILWGLDRGNTEADNKHKNSHNSGLWASPKWSSIDTDHHARPYIAP